MKFVKFFLSLLFTAVLVYTLNTKWGAVPPLGKLLSPQHGLWQNGDPARHYTHQNFQFGNLKGKVQVHMDKRLVPHIFAEHDEDAYFVQGYLHAKYRLWQMEFQTMFAAGRISEIVGEKALPLDRKFRRLGMVWAANKAAIEMQKDSLTKMAVTSYADGVNAYINSLSDAQLPIEYKLLDYKPEQWSVHKSALLLKYMSFDLAGYEDDFERANAKTILTKAMYETAYQYGNDLLDPIVPANTSFASPGVKLKIPNDVETAYFNFGKANATDVKDGNKPNPNNGSNNWAVAGSKTKSGRPILCNDPHLGLNMPSLWYEQQINTPTQNSYGVAFPGAPGVIIGFNDNCSWGFTNAMRDVRDYYEIKFKDNSRKEYMYNGSWQPTEIHYDTIKIRGKAAFIDTVAYVKEYGPVMYDASYRGTGIERNKELRSDGKNYAVKWLAHMPSNELLTFLKLDRSKNYNDYLDAISTFVCPAQNMIFCTKSGDIALKQQGLFPAKWYRQGDFPMPGWDSTYNWQGMIPSNENIQMYNPDRGFVSSANQYPYSTKTYPYYLGGNYPFARGKEINNLLSSMSNITVEDMQKLQTNNTNVHAKLFLPFLLTKLKRDKLNTSAKIYAAELAKWDYRADVGSTNQTVFTFFAKALEDAVWQDELSGIKNSVKPVASTVFDAIIRDSNMVFVDNIKTTQKETLSDIVTQALNAASIELDKLKDSKKLAWGSYKATYLKHLMAQDMNWPFSIYNLPIGGGQHIINATQQQHGPGWRMVVHMTDDVEAYGIYPGGQSGHPGSKYYSSFANDWANGKYNKLWLMKPTEKSSKDIQFTLNFSKLNYL